jgi:hypothetical protein
MQQEQQYQQGQQRGQDGRRYEERPAADQLTWDDLMAVERINRRPPEVRELIKALILED